MSPTARSLQWLRKQGFVPAVVERFNSFSKQRHDLFNAFDLVALHPHQHGLLGIQVTSKSNASSRRNKLLQNPLVALWLSSSNPVHLHYWGKKQGKWVLTREVIYLHHVDNTLRAEAMIDE